MLMKYFGIAAGNHVEGTVTIELKTSSTGAFIQLGIS